MHPETKQLREDENEYQRSLDKAELRGQAIDTEVSMLRVDIGVKSLHNNFVFDWIADPSAELANMIRTATLYNRAQTAQLGEAIMTMVNDMLYRVAEHIVDGRRGE